MRYKLPAFAVALCLFAAPVAHATVVRPLDFAQLTGKATAIAYGRVAAVTPQWATDRPGIETMVTIQVTSYLKGDLGPQLTFRVPGGKIGRFRSVTAGAPAFQEGEEVVVFLGAAGPTIPTIVGFNQGVFRVSLNRFGARVVMPPPMADVTTPTPIVRGDPSRKPIPLTQFQARVRSVLQDRSDDPGREPRPRAVVRDRHVR